MNLPWYLKQEGLLDLAASDLLDDYFVVTGLISAAASSYGGTRPWRIDHVHLFRDAH